MKIFVFFLYNFVFLIIILFLFFYPELKKKFDSKYFSMSVYRKLHYLAEDNDYLLLNDVKLDLKDEQDTTFNHILFADKYIYIIQDIYLDGGLGGSYEDTYLSKKEFKGKPTKMVNFLLAQRNKVILFCNQNGIDPEDNSVFNVVCYNSSLVVPHSLKKKDYGEWFVSLKDLIKTIKISEKDNVKSLKKEYTQSLFNQLKDNSDKLKSYQRANFQ